jgi:hypothetical protein
MLHRMSLVWSCLGILSLCGFSYPAFGGQILKDTFSSQSSFPSFPKNWTLLIGAKGDINVVSNGHLVMTDSTGTGAGIVSSLSSSIFNPVGFTTTDSVVINSVSKNPIGNAIFGLIGPTTGGELAAGIDSTGNVFIVESDPTKNISQKIVLVGMDKGYAGGPIGLTLTINSTGSNPGVDVTSASGFNSGFKSFSSDLFGFTLTGAFGGNAIPALVGASQPGQKGGAASFASVTVNTVLGSAVPEPSSFQILAIGLAGLGVVESLRRRMRVRC